DDADELLLDALRLYREAGDFRGEQSVTNYLGIGAAFRGDSVVALEWFQQTADAARRAGNLRGLAMVTTNLAAILFELGRLEEALPMVIEAQERHDALGAGPGRQATPHLKAVIHQERGELDEALAVITAEIAAVRRTGRRQGLAMSTEALATIHRDRGEYG